MPKTYTHNTNIEYYYYLDLIKITNISAILAWGGSPQKVGDYVIFA